MIREANPSDAACLERFLAQHADTSMFLRSNLRAHGVGLGPSEHSTRYFVWGNRDIRGVFGLTQKGYLMAQLPDCETEAADAFAQMIAGQTVLGMTGDVPQVEVTLQALGFGNARYRLHHDEPLYRFDLGTLNAPRVSYRALCETDRPVLESWFADYLVDTGQANEEEARDMAADRIARELQERRTIVLLEEDAPAAMASVNASVDDQIQVGGVFVPRSHRNRGLGRKVTIALMQKAKSEGACQAILFANNPSAARAYEAIGFQQVGWYRIALLQDPQKVMT